MDFMSKKHFFNKGNAKGMGRKGGKANKGKTSIALSLINRVHCKPDCKIYFDCPFMIASKKFKGKCALKQAPSYVQGWVVDVLTKGSEGMITTLRKLAIDLMIESKTGKFRERKDAYYALKDLHEMIYGKKIKQEVTGEIKSEITVNDFKKAMKEMKE